MRSNEMLVNEVIDRLKNQNPSIRENKSYRSGLKELIHQPAQQHRKGWKITEDKCGWAQNNFYG